MYSSIHWTRHLVKPYSPYKYALNISITISTINPLQHLVLPIFLLANKSQIYNSYLLCMFQTLCFHHHQSPLIPTLLGVDGSKTKSSTLIFIQGRGGYQTPSQYYTPSSTCLIYLLSRTSFSNTSLVECPEIYIFIIQGLQRNILLFPSGHSSHL